MSTTARQIAGENSQSLNCIANELLVCLVKERLDEMLAAVGKNEEEDGPPANLHLKAVQV